MSDTTDLSSVASTVSTNFSSLTKLITTSSYVAGLGFSVASIAKFKAHKDNPTQIPVGTPAALTAVSAALTFLPSIASTGVSASGVESAAKESGISASEVESAAAGVTSSEVDAAKSTLKEKLSG